MRPLVVNRTSRWVAISVAFWLLSGCVSAREGRPPPDFLPRSAAPPAAGKLLPQPEVRRISVLAIPEPNVQFRGRAETSNGNALLLREIEKSPQERERMSFNLVRALVRAHPPGVSIVEPMPDGLGDQAALGVCHRDSLIGLADLLATPGVDWENTAGPDPIRFVAGVDEPLCGHPAYQKADVLVVSSLESLNGPGLPLFVGKPLPMPLRTLEVAVATGLVKSAMTNIEFLTYDVVLVDNQTHRVLAAFHKTSGASAAEDTLDRFAREAMDCFGRLAGKPPGKDETPEAPRCRSYHRFEFVGTAK